MWKQRALFGDSRHEPTVALDQKCMSNKKVTFRCPSGLVKQAKSLAKIRTRVEGEEVSASDIYRRALTMYLRYRSNRGDAPDLILDQ